LDKENGDLEKLRMEILELSTSELDRELAEVKNDLIFLEAQISNDLESYSPEQLEKARARIHHFKKKCGIINDEIEKRRKVS
jgi:hypothetical protein